MLLALSTNEQVGPGRWLIPTSEADPLPNAGFCLPVKSIIPQSLPIQRLSFRVAVGSQGVSRAKGPLDRSEQGMCPGVEKLLLQLKVDRLQNYPWNR